MNYEKKTISIQKANLLGLLLLPILGCFLIPYYHYWEFPDVTLFLNAPLNLVVFMAIIMLSVLIHELIHGLCFMLFAKEGQKSVKIGFIWKYLTPYAHCKEPLSKAHYRIALLMPGLILGIIPIVIGLSFGYFFLFILGLFLTLAAGGDLIILILTYSVAVDRKLLDHPSECGFFIIDKSF
jgi:membrane-associated HD superfamily phosphohydrolase